MAVTTAAGPGDRGRAAGMWSRVTAALWRRPWARATLLLTAPLAWFVLIYLAALAVLLITAFWQINPFTTNIERVWSLDNLHMIVASPAYRGIILRTVGIAAAVTVTDAVVAFPFAYFMARIASGRARTILFMAILLPLWASYLAKVYSWLLIFTHDGILDWSLGKIGLGQIHLIYTNWAVYTVFCYLWLPFMVIPVYAALERIPASQIEASPGPGRPHLADHADGAVPARAARHRRRVDLHVLADPGRLHHAAAGRRDQRQLHRATSSTPTSASRTTCRSPPPWRCIPIAIMAIYLLGARALGAFEEI